MKTDIENEADVKVLVDTFYESVNQDALLSPVFNGHAQVDWQSHLPVMYSFWSSILFGSMAYKGQPFPKHLRLPISPEHFNRWTHLFSQAADNQFKGPKTEEAKQKALSIAKIFQMKMGMFGALQ